MTFDVGHVSAPNKMMDGLVNFKFETLFHFGNGHYQLRLIIKTLTTLTKLRKNVHNIFASKIFEPRSQ